jgi:hypothetical protein
MTYLSAASKADEATKRAKAAWRDAEGDGKDSLEHLGMAVAHLSEAVADLARSLHRGE